MRSRKPALAIALAVLVSLGGTLWWGSRPGDGRAVEVPPERRGSAEAAAAELSTPEVAETVRQVGADAGSDASLGGVSETEGAFLRVVDAEGRPRIGASLGCSMVLDAGEEGLRVERLGGAELVTDDQGCIDLAERGPTNRTIRGWAVRIVGDPAQTLEPAVFPLDALGTTRQSAPTARVVTLTTAPLRGRVVAAGDGRPLAGYGFYPTAFESALGLAPAREGGLAGLQETRVWSELTEEGPRWLVTDEQGRFELEGDLPAGRLYGWTLDQQAWAVDHRPAPDGSAPAVVVVVEPPVELLLALDPPRGYGIEDLLARVHPDGLAGAVGLRERRVGARSFAALGDAYRLRSGPPASVQLPAQSREADLPTWVVVSSDDGRVYGAGRVEDFRRHATEPLAIELHMRDVLDVVVRWPRTPDGTAVLEDYEFVPLDLLQARAAPGAEAVTGSMVARTNDELETAVRLYDVPQGPHRLVLARWQPGRRTLRQQAWDVTLPEPDVLTLDPTPVSPPERRTLLGVLRTETGAPLDGLEGRAHVRSVTVRPDDRFAYVDWSDGVGRFVAEEVGMGPVTLRMQWSAGRLETSPSELAFDFTGEPLEVHVHDDIPTERVVLRVVAPPVSDAIARLTLAVGEDALRIRRSRGFELSEATVERPDDERAWELVLGPVPSGTPVTEAVVELPGHETIWPSDMDFVRDGRGRRVATVVPRPGWSVRVRVVRGQEFDDEAPVPLAGVVLVFDGVETAPSDADGIVLHAADAAPAGVAVASTGWRGSALSPHWREGRWDAATGEFQPDDGELTLVLEPDE